MAIKFVMEDLGNIEADELLENTRDIKVLLNTEFLNDEDNILLNRRLIELLYSKILTIESKLKRFK